MLVNRLLLIGSLALATSLAIPAYSQDRDWHDWNRDHGRWNWGQDRDHDWDHDHDRDHDRNHDRDRHDRDRHDRNGNYGRGNGQAARQGYQDGLMYGRNDAGRGKGFNATGSDYYQHADHGYNSGFGDKNAYRQEYRQAYQRGYQQGYNSARGGRRY